jgi:hypothetical protein
MDDRLNHLNNLSPTNLLGVWATHDLRQIMCRGVQLLLFVCIRGVTAATEVNELSLHHVICLFRVLNPSFVQGLLLLLEIEIRWQSTSLSCLRILVFNR